MEARVVAIADVFDALCSERPYKKAWPPGKAFAEIVAGSGSHFGPACVEAFRRRWPEFEALLGSRKEKVEVCAGHNVGGNYPA